MTTIRNSQRCILLASASPRRFELMSRVGFEPRVVTSRVEEIPRDESAEEYTRRLALEKAQAAILDEVSEELVWVLAADTVVVRDGVILEKPGDRAEAVQMLSSLSGRGHDVLTSFCVRNRRTGQARVEAVTTSVYFRSIDTATIERYVDTGEPYDKAGGYGIQGIAEVFVSRLDGSYSNVVGLPVSEVVAALVELGALIEFPFELESK